MSLGMWILIVYAVGVALVVGVIGYWGRIALKAEDRWKLEMFSDVLVRVSVFRMLTVALIVGGVLMLAVEDRLDGETTSALLGGIVGYVLGGISSDRSNPPAKSDNGQPVER